MMRRLLPLLGSLVLAGLAACTCGSTESEGTDEAETSALKQDTADKTLLKAKTPKAKNHYGAPFVLDRSRPLAAVVAEGVDSNKRVQVKGKVKSVCKRRGCWLILVDEGLRARIVSKDHSFSVPGKAVGRVAIAEGFLAEHTFSEAEARHLEKDRGGDPDLIVGDQQEIVMMATAVQVTGKKKKGKRKGKKKKKKRGKKKRDKKKSGKKKKAKKDAGRKGEETG